MIHLAKESEITTIRVPKSVKDELDDVSLEKESYHVTIQRLIRENKQLKQTNERYNSLIKIITEKIKYWDNMDDEDAWNMVKENYGKNGD